MFTKLRRKLFTWIEVHGTHNCFVYFYLCGFSLGRIRSFHTHNLVFDLKTKKLMVVM